LINNIALMKIIGHVMIKISPKIMLQKLQIREKLNLMSKLKRKIVIVLN
jgi:hypothetical protein